MAKNLKHETDATISKVPVSQLYSDRDQNWGRMYSGRAEPKTLEVLRKSLKELTWISSVFVQCRKMTPEEQAKYYNRLQAEWQAWKDKAHTPVSTELDKDNLRVFEVMHLDKNGKLIKPVYLMMTGNQRFSQLHGASLDRWYTGIKEKWGALGVDCPVNPEDGLPTKVTEREAPEEWVIKTVPVEIVEYASEEEQVAAQYAENGIKRIGDTPPNRLDQAMVAQKIVQLRGKLPTEAELARILKLTKRGEIQDVWRMVAIDWYGGEQLNYLNRCCLRVIDEKGVSKPDVDNPDYINYTWRLSNTFSPDVKKLSVLMINRMNPAWVDKTRTAMLANGKDEADIPEHGKLDEFIKWFNWRPTKETVKVTKMDYAGMEAGAKVFGADVLNDFMDGCKKGDLDPFLEKYGELKDAFNMIVKLRDMIGIDLINDALSRVLICENPTHVVEDWIAMIPAPKAEVVQGTVIEARRIESKELVSAE